MDKIIGGGATVSMVNSWCLVQVPAGVFVYGVGDFKFVIKYFHWVYCYFKR